jgi:hypothetical protein
MEGTAHTTLGMLLEDKNFGSSDLVDSDWRWLERLFQIPEDRELCIECVEQGSRPTKSVFDRAELTKFIKEVENAPHMDHVSYTLQRGIFDRQS